MTDTTAQHIATRNDADLVARLVASAEQLHIPNADSFILANIGEIISTETSPGSTITTVHAYASVVRQQAIEALPPLPGQNPAAVTDDQLAEAIQAVVGTQTGA